MNFIQQINFKIKKIEENILRKKSIKIYYKYLKSAY